jgi:hypothetical protein
MLQNSSQDISPISLCEHGDARHGSTNLPVRRIFAVLGLQSLNSETSVTAKGGEAGYLGSRSSHFRHKGLHRIAELSLADCYTIENRIRMLVRKMR